MSKKISLKIFNLFDYNEYPKIKLKGKSWKVGKYLKAAYGIMSLQI